MDIAFDLNRFMQQKGTRRQKSLLAEDFVSYDAELHHWIDNKRVSSLATQAPSASPPSHLVPTPVSEHR